MNQWLFEDTYCRVVRKRFGGNREVRVIEGSKNMDDLRRRMSGFMQRVRKEDVLKDLPPIRWDIVPLDVDASAVNQLSDLPPGLDDDELLKYLSGATGEEHVMRLRHHLGMAKVEPAVEYIQDFMEGLPPDRKILVFAHHKDVIAGLAAAFGGSYRAACIVGATGARDRAIEIDRFLEDSRCRVFIGNITAAGTGLTLVGPRCKCADVFFVEATYSVGDNVQAAARVHRIGQKEGVVARMLTAHGTIDDRIQDILARKASDFQQLFD